QHFTLLAVLAANQLKLPLATQPSKPKPPPPRKRPFVRNLFRRAHNHQTESIPEGTRQYSKLASPVPEDITTGENRKVSVGSLRSNAVTTASSKPTGSQGGSNVIADGAISSQAQSMEAFPSASFGSHRLGCSRGGIPHISPPLDMKHLVHVDHDWVTGHGLSDTSLRLFPVPSSTCSHIPLGSTKRTEPLMSDPSEPEWWKTLNSVYLPSITHTNYTKSAVSGSTLSCAHYIPSEIDECRHVDGLLGKNHLVTAAESFPHKYHHYTRNLCSRHGRFQSSAHGHSYHKCSTCSASKLSAFAAAAVQPTGPAVVDTRQRRRIQSVDRCDPPTVCQCGRVAVLPELPDACSIARQAEIGQMLGDPSNVYTGCENTIRGDPVFSPPPNRSTQYRRAATIDRSEWQPALIPGDQAAESADLTDRRRSASGPIASNYQCDYSYHTPDCSIRLPPFSDCNQQHSPSTSVPSSTCSHIPLGSTKRTEPLMSDPSEPEWWKTLNSVYLPSITHTNYTKSAVSGSTLSCAHYIPSEIDECRHVDGLLGKNHLVTAAESFPHKYHHYTRNLCSRHGRFQSSAHGHSYHKCSTCSASKLSAFAAAAVQPTGPAVVDTRQRRRIQSVDRCDPPTVCQCGRVAVLPELPDACSIARQAEIGDPHSPFLGMLAGSGRRPNPSLSGNDSKSSHPKSLSPSTYPTCWLCLHNQSPRSIPQCQHFLTSSDQIHRRHCVLQRCATPISSEAAPYVSNEAAICNICYCSCRKQDIAEQCYLHSSSTSSSSSSIGVQTDSNQVLRSRTPHPPCTAMTRWRLPTSVDSTRNDISADPVLTGCSETHDSDFRLPAEQSVLSWTHLCAERETPVVKLKADSHPSLSVESYNPVAHSRDAYLKATQDGYLNRVAHIPKASETHKEQDNFALNSSTASTLRNQSLPLVYSVACEPSDVVRPMKDRSKLSPNFPESGDSDSDIEFLIPCPRGQEEDGLTLVPADGWNVRVPNTAPSPSFDQEQPLESDVFKRTAREHLTSPVQRRLPRRPLHRSPAMRTVRRPDFLFVRNRSLPERFDVPSSQPTVCCTTPSKTPISLPTVTHRKPSPCGPFVSLHSTML
ncbi:hypothetical protein AHF37_05641, partial [Paragonimus kellicotti]